VPEWIVDILRNGPIAATIVASGEARFEPDLGLTELQQAWPTLTKRMPVPGRDVVWLADQVIAIAQHLGSVAFDRVQGADGPALVCRTDSTQMAIAGRDPLRLFRPLLARFAVPGADEVGGEPQLHGGRYELVRSSRTGPVRLGVASTNTSGSQQITITRVPAAVAPRTGSAPGAGVVDSPPQPSA
jgi:hypothetical protein